MSSILVLPGWMRYIKFYHPEPGFIPAIGKLDKDQESADCVAGLSLGALIVLRDAKRIKGKIILINPPIPHRNLLVWFIQWLKFIFSEGLFFERQKFIRNPLRFAWEVLRAIPLMATDFDDFLASLPKDKILIIRGKNDRFFCDAKAMQFIRSRNIPFKEIDGGHNWSETMENALMKI